MLTISLLLVQGKDLSLSALFLGYSVVCWAALYLSSTSELPEAESIHPVVYHVGQSPVLRPVFDPVPTSPTLSWFILISLL